MLSTSSQDSVDFAAGLEFGNKAVVEMQNSDFLDFKPFMAFWKMDGADGVFVWEISHGVNWCM
jgi:hypothetical protein